MKIIVKKLKIENEITVALDDYEKEYKKLLVLYHKKLIKYLTYVTKELKSKKLQQLKHPPMTPSWQRNYFIETLAALKAHGRDEIEMDDHEYSEIKSGIKRLRNDLRTSTMSLNSLSYR